jgi:hypothetical protein
MSYLLATMHIFGSQDVATMAIDSPSALQKYAKEQFAKRFKTEVLVGKPSLFRIAPDVYFS